MWLTYIGPRSHGRGKPSRNHTSSRTLASNLSPLSLLRSLEHVMTETSMIFFSESRMSGSDDGVGGQLVVLEFLECRGRRGAHRPT